MFSAEAQLAEILRFPLIAWSADCNGFELSCETHLRMRRLKRAPVAEKKGGRFAKIYKTRVSQFATRSQFS